MNKRMIFESLTISALFVALITATVFAGYPGPDSDEDYDFDDYGWGCWAYAYVEAEYSDPETYTSEDFLSRRHAVSAENYGAMYYCYFIDDVYFEGYDNDNSHSGSSGIDCTFAAAYTVAYFKSGATIDSCGALAYREIA